MSNEHVIFMSKSSFNLLLPKNLHITLIFRYNPFLIAIVLQKLIFLTLNNNSVVMCYI